MKFKNYIEVQSGIKDSANSPGTLDQVLTSTATGVAWVDPSTISAEAATLVAIECKNTSGATITKGTPVYQTGTVGATDVIEIAVADASDEDKMAAIGLLQTTLNNNGFGKVVITGELLNITTSPIDGVTPITGDTIYVKPGGGLTLTKPTGINFIQNVGLVGKVSGGNAGSITVSSIMRSNDVPTPLYIDHDDQRLGIGTSSPAEKLDVYNNGGDVAIRIHEDAGTHEARLHLRRGGSDWELINNNNFTIESEGSEKFRITTTGNVGIGTTSPENKLHVQQSALYTGIQTTAGIRVKSDGGSAIGNYHGTIALSRGTGSVAISAVQEAADSDVMGMAFFTHPSSTGGDAAVEQMRIDQNGNVGIGTSSPTGDLTIGRNGNASGGNIMLGSTTNATNKYAVITSQSYNSSTDTEGFATIATQGISGTNLVTIGGGIGEVDSATQLRFYTSSATGTRTGSERMRIDSSGNVGIGTTSPGQKLDVDGSVNIDGTLFVNANNNHIRLIDADNTGNFSVGVNSNFQIRDITANTTPLTIRAGTPDNTILTTASGRVGIGLSSPSTTLHVGGFTRINGGLQMNTANATIYQILDSALRFGTNNAERMRITNTGQVGIGITAITASVNADDLQIGNGTGGNRGLTVTAQSNSGAAIYFGDADNTNMGSVRYDNSNDSMKFFTNTSEQIRIDSSGNVGIGVTSPSAKLDVDGAGNFSGGTVVSGIDTSTDVGVAISKGDYLYSNDGNYLRRLIGQQSGGSIDIGQQGTGLISNINFFPGTSGNIDFFGSGSIDVRVASSGNVGIGTTSPSSKLHVNYEDAESVLTISRGGTNLSAGAAIGTIQFNADYQGSPISYGSIDMYANSLSGVRSSLDFNVKSTSGGIQTGLTVQGNSGTPRVGIGTTSPGTKLEVNGDIGIGRVAGGYTFRETVGGSERASIKSNATNELIFSYGASTEAMRIDDTGSVGIGTTSPSSKLQVAGGIQMADDTATASAAKVGTLKYRVSGNNSYVDMCMQTGATTYAWINIVQNNW